MPRGGRRPGAGRPKGSPNKLTADARKLFQALLERKGPEIEQMIEDTWRVIEIEKQLPDGQTVVGRLNADPGKAADLVLKLAEFVVPKLGRQEHVGESGGPVVVEIRKFTE